MWLDSWIRAAIIKRERAIQQRANELLQDSWIRANELQQRRNELQRAKRRKEHTMITDAQRQTLLDCVYTRIDGVRIGAIIDYDRPIDKELAALYSARDFLLNLEVSE